MKKITPLFGIIVVALLAAIVYILVITKSQQEAFFYSNGNQEAITEQETLPEEAELEDTQSEALIETNKQTMTTATFTTNKGTFEVELFSGLAPKTTENFTKLAESGFYKGVKFHRVIEGFMIQTGDPLSKDDDMQDRWGTGGPGYQFADEIYAENRNAIGTLSMANSGPNTNGSQFFINTADNDFLDTKHTVFGKVTSGLEVIKEIEEVETLPNDRPVEAVVIESITIKK